MLYSGTAGALASPLGGAKSGCAANLMTLGTAGGLLIVPGMVR